MQRLWILVLIQLFMMSVQGHAAREVRYSTTCVLITVLASNGFDILSLNSTSNCRGVTFPSTLLTKENTRLLQTIDLANCRLSGKIFSYINSTVLSYIDVQGNNFRDTIPVWFGYMPTLNVFNIANNDFYGVVPNFSWLYTLDIFNIANNSLTGHFQTVVPFAMLSEYSIAGNNFYLDTSNTQFQFVGQPYYILADGVAEDGMVQIDCVTVYKGAGVKIPFWCAGIDASGASRCTCRPQCGNGILEEGELCETSGANRTACCSPTCQSYGRNCHPPPSSP